MKRFGPFIMTLVLALAACGPNPATPTAAPVPLATVPPTPLVLAAPMVTAPQMTSFKMLDALNGWATSATNLLRTNDGGETWYNVTPPGVTSMEPSFSTYYYDSAHAWLIVPVSDFSAGTLYLTVDGGSTWASAALSFSGAWMQFFDPQTGIALAALGAGAGSEAVALFTTSNGGAAWTRIYINDPTVPGASDTLPLSGQKSALGFRLPTDGFVGGSVPVEDYFYLFETQDGGVTWSERSLPWPAGRAGYFTGVEEIKFVSQQEGYIVASLTGDRMEDYIYQTTDGGDTWTQTGEAIPRSLFFSILPGPTIFCWSPDHTILSTLDGSTWVETTPHVDFGDALRLLQFVNATTGFALTVDQFTSLSAFYITHDAGASWTTLIP